MLQRIKHNIANSNVQMELRKSALRHHCIDRIPRAALRSAIQIHHRSAHSKGKEIVQVALPSLLEMIEHGLTRRRRHCAHREVEILSRARNPETKFHCMAPF